MDTKEIQENENAAAMRQMVQGYHHFIAGMELLWTPETSQVMDACLDQIRTALYEFAKNLLLVQGRMTPG